MNDADERLNRLLKPFLMDFGFAPLTATRPQEGLKPLRRKEAPCYRSREDSL